MEPRWPQSQCVQSWWGVCGDPKVFQLKADLGAPGALWKAGVGRKESAEVDHGASRPNKCVLGKQFCSRGLFIGMFFLSTPFPHLLPFVLKGAWQIGKGLQAMHRKLWNTMNGAGTDPHPPKKASCCSTQRPWGRQLELSAGLGFFKRRQHA